jgi:demethylmenaquinone methyltransferase/2-methoxy-6-polyprenyl-1,4-benzoquinol methylase
MRFSKQAIQARYDSEAWHYDAYVRLFRALGMRIGDYRSRAVELMRLRRGARVVELGCGTGSNFLLLEERVGAEGRLIGVDNSPEMLALARRRVEESGWSNVELIESDIVAYEFPAGIDGVLASGVFGYIAEYDRVIERASRALVSSGRLVILDGTRPEALPAPLYKLAMLFARRFGVTGEYLDRPTWESTQRHFRRCALEREYGGMIYVCTGWMPRGGRPEGHHGRGVDPGAHNAQTVEPHS